MPDATMKPVFAPTPTQQDRAPTGLRAGGDEIDERLFVASVGKAMKVLETFDKNAASLSLSDVAIRTGLGRSASQRFIYTLERLGYLDRDEQSKRYMLSKKVFRFAQNSLSSNIGLDAAYPIMRQLSERTRETISWVEVDGADIVIIATVASTHISSVNLPVGTRFPALSSSSGQMLLAHSAPSHVEKVWAASDSSVAPRTRASNATEMLRILETVKAAGFSVTEKNMEQGSISVSAPVHDRAGRAIGAINLSTLTTRYDRQMAIEQLAPLVMHAAQRTTEAIVS
jgi:IclR family pca regulon transcriptional regulator